MMITLKKIETAQEIEELARLAHEIWFEYWPARIGQAQTEYMVDQFQSAPAITRAIREEGYEYSFVLDAAGKVVGYTGVVREYFAECPGSEAAAAHGSAITPLYPNRLFISKVYLLAEERGKHYASEILRKLAEYAREQGLSGMYLTVNKDNNLAIRAYEGNGFNVIEEVCAEIGNGFVMDDYIMACPIERLPV